MINNNAVRWYMITVNGLKANFLPYALGYSYIF